MKNLLIIGVGSIGKRHLENFKKFFHNIDIVDNQVGRLEEVQDKYRIRSSFTDYKKAFKEGSYNAAVIATPPHTHLDIANNALKHNVNIFIEKPLGMNVKGWSKLASLYKNKKLVNYVGFCHRHINFTKKLKKILSKNLIGRICGVNVRWGSYLPDWHPWEDYRSFYMAKKNEGGGALYDECHGLDLLRYFFGEVTEVSAFVGNTSDLEISSDDCAFLNLKMKKNFFSQINFDLYSRYPRVSFEVLGSQGNIIWDRIDFNIKIYFAKTKKWKILQYTKNDLLNMYSEQARHFYSCILKKQKPFVDISDAIKTQKIIDASFLSSKKSKTIKIKS